MQHLRALATAGLNTVHLLPVFDIATIPERRADQPSPACDLASFGPPSEQQQACVTAVAADDGFNWGYDPWHYTTPEGSYATEPGRRRARTLEFRQMVAALNQAGLRVVMDVVYNHTTASGQDPKSVLDRVVPGYYHRLSATGAVETSTCCANTASEHLMMEKLMVDSVVTWARDYKVDGFRFDLMGHHSLANMLAVREALDELTLQRDGVDGKRIYLYGEGWNFGEVADGARFRQASQLRARRDRHRLVHRPPARRRPRRRTVRRRPADPGLRQRPVHRPQRRGRQRHAGRAAGPPAAVPRPDQGRAGRQPARLRVRRPHRRDGDRRRRRLQRAAGRLRRRSVGDDHVRRRPRQRDAVRRAAVQAAAGDGDGRPGADEHASPWPRRRCRRARRSGTPAPTCCGRSRWIATPSTRATGSTASTGRPPSRRGAPACRRAPTTSRSGRSCGRCSPTRRSSRGPTTWPPRRPRPPTLLRIRFSSPLFRLGSADRIQERVDFPIGGPGQTPGVITMTLDDRAGRDLDRQWEGIVVVFNATPQPQTQTVAALAGAGYRLHPVQATGADDVVRGGDLQPVDRRLHRPGAHGGGVHHPLNPELSASERRRGFV